MLICSVYSWGAVARYKLLFLLTILSFLLASCGDPSPAPAKVGKEQWQQEGAKRLGRVNAEKCPDVKNALITASYAQMYLLDSGAASYKWSGLAAFASNLVGAGISLPRLGNSPLSPDEYKTLQTLLIKGNNAVYDDLYWQHLAYKEAGLAELERIQSSGSLPAELLEGWRKLDKGRKDNNPDAIWEGNAILLRYEQEKVLQPVVYEGNNDLWRKVGVLSPVFGHRIEFKNYVPGGDFASFADRWKWISESMLLAWRNLETTDPTTVEVKLKELTGDPLKNRPECVR